MRSIDPADLLALIHRGAAPPIVDARTRAEFAAGHVPGAINVPFTEAWGHPIGSTLAASPTVVLYCERGPRAWIASVGVRRWGSRRIVYLRGHLAAWRRAALPLE